MIAEEQGRLSAAQTTFGKVWPWLNVALTVIFIGLGLWYIVRRVSLAEIGAALVLAKVDYIALGLATILVTSFVKTWRWQLLLGPRQRTSFGALFWALMLGQYVNLLLPVLRLGEIARVYALDRQADTGKARVLGTIVVEKTLDTIMLGLTVALLLSAVILPDFLDNSDLALGAVALVVFLTLYLVAYQTEFVIGICQRLASYLPERLGQWLIRLIVSGLEGLSALRDHRVTLALLGSSVVIAVLSVLTPLVLFPALNIPLGLTEAALIHVVVTIALIPPSTPAKIGVFDGAVAFLLLRLGLKNEVTIVSYTILYHLVVILPLILLGSIAASRSNWRWLQPTTAPDESQVAR